MAFVYTTLLLKHEHKSKYFQNSSEFLLFLDSVQYLCQLPYYIFKVYKLVLIKQYQLYFQYIIYYGLVFLARECFLAC